ncbi:MAG: acyltransferase family protein [Roseiflexaceae bacterium]
MTGRIWWIVTTVWLAVLWLLPLPIRIDIGRWDEIAVTNFYGAEYGAGTSFRWSEPEASIEVAGVGAGVYDIHIMASSAVPTALTVTVADTTQRIQITPGFTRHTIRVPIPLAWHDRVVVALRVADPLTIERRTVGVALDEIRFVPQGVTWPAWLAWLLSVVVVIITAFWMRWWIRPVHWRWFGALAFISAIIVLRRGDAVQLLWLWFLMSSLSMVAVHQPSWPRRRIGVFVVLMAGAIGISIWLIGTAIWSPIWQLVVLIGVVWAMRYRRWWWSYLRLYRHWLLRGILIACVALGPIGWIMAAIMSIAWLGARRDWWLVKAAASIGPLIDRWLQGGRSGGVDISSRRIGLDVVRAFAISTVVLGHASATLAYYPVGLAWIPQWFAFVGVECFFVLSGWLIGGLIIRALPTWQHGDAVQLFLHRRWGRTLPPYWLMLMIVAVAGWGGATWQVLTPYWLFGQNIWQAHPPYFFVAWSLAVEEWFYLLTALGVALLARVMRPARGLLLVLLILTLIPLMLRTWLALGDLPWEAGLRQFVPLRLDAIALGMLMVWSWHLRNRVVLPLLTWIGVVGGVVSVWFFWQSHTALDSAVWARVLLIPLTTLSVALLLPALASWQSVVSLWWHHRIQYIAAISYSLYLVHIPWRLTVEGLFGGIGLTWWRDILITMIYLMGAVWLAGQWYRLFETPLMALRWPDKTETPRRVDEG